MDITQFLLALAFALLVLLIGWSNQILSKNKEIKYLEDKFAIKIKEKYKEDYKKITQKTGSFTENLDAFSSFLSQTDEEDIVTINEIGDIQKNIKKLNNRYDFRFWILFSIVSLFTLCGVISYFIPDEYKMWFGLSFIISMIALSLNLIRTYILEKNHINKINVIMEKI